MFFEPFSFECSLAFITFTQFEATFKFDRFPPNLGLHDLLLILEILISLGLLIAHPSTFIFVECSCNLAHYALAPFELGIQNIIEANG